MAAGGYLCLHDTALGGDLPGLWQLYQDILRCGEYDLVSEMRSTTLVVLRRKSL